MAWKILSCPWILFRMNDIKHHSEKIQIFVAKPIMYENLHHPSCSVDGIAKTFFIKLLSDKVHVINLIWAISAKTCYERTPTLSLELSSYIRYKMLIQPSGEDSARIYNAFLEVGDGILNWVSIKI